MSKEIQMYANDFVEEEVLEIPPKKDLTLDGIKMEHLKPNEEDFKEQIGMDTILSKEQTSFVKNNSDELYKEGPKTKTHTDSHTNRHNKNVKSEGNILTVKGNSEEPILDESDEDILIDLKTTSAGFHE